MLVSVRKVGVEEELLLVDPETGLQTAVAAKALRAHDEAVSDSDVEPGDLAEPADDDPGIEAELFLQQLETTSTPCERMDELADQLRRGRRTVGELARDAGAAAVAVPIPVLMDEDADVTPKPRYRRIREEFGELARTSLACAMHMHVEVADDEEGARVLDGIGPWLPVLLAISANSPYWCGRDTGYASWRSQIWTRWPSHGTGEPFGSAATYDETTAKLVEWGAALDTGMLYFDARLSQNFPTVEIRVADVCTELDDAILIAALGRGLVESTAAGGEGPAWRSELLRAASWRASRYGLAGQLVHPVDLRLAPAREVVEALVAHASEALKEAGDLELVQDLCERILARGGGATRQRSTFEARGDLQAVVSELAQRTEQSWQEG